MRWGFCTRNARSSLARSLKENTVKQLAFACGAALLLCLSVPSHTFAQVNATVGGTVSDASGAVIAMVACVCSTANTSPCRQSKASKRMDFRFFNFKIITQSMEAVDMQK